MSEYRSVRDLDWPLLIISFVICGFGVLQIYSATRGTIWQDAWWKQIIYIAAGLVLMWLASLIDYHALLHHVDWLYALSVVGLLGTSTDRQAGFRVAALDSRRRRVPFPGVGICQAGDNIVGSPLSDGSEDG